jgi:hypothetical protein
VGGLLLGTAVVAGAPTTHAAETAVCKSWRWDYYKQVKTHYPVRLHGTTVYLYNGGGRNQSYALIKNGRQGDRLAIQRAKKFTTKKKWWTTGQLQRKGVDWHTCLGNQVRTPLVNNWHVPVRACLYRHGFRACSNWWYADQT